MASEPDREARAPWRFAQCFGDKGDSPDVTQADIISAVEFDHTGDYLATGDKGGRVVIFERKNSSKGCEYQFYTEFQSHEPEFDYLKSLEIEEKINKIKWCRRQNAAHFLLTTNDKTIKLWKVFEKSLQMVAENNLTAGIVPSAAAYVNKPINPLRVKPGSGLHLRLPRVNVHDTIVAAVPRRMYANAHAYHINSISANSDAETLLSADDLRINLWNLGRSDKSFNIVDIKPANMEDLTEVITAADFHPVNCNNFIYSTSKGDIKMADMRDAALCDHHSMLFRDTETDAAKSFFSEIISSISDVQFSHDGRYLLSRDYLTVKVWDMAMGRAPIATIPVHEHIRSRLCDVYENDCIFDKFEALWGPDNHHIMTGSYSNYFHVFDTDMPDAGASGVTLQADKSAFNHKKTAGKGRGKMTGPGPVAQIDVDNVDLAKKILHASYHPREHTAAIAATNNLFIFTAGAAGVPAHAQGVPTQLAI